MVLRDRRNDMTWKAAYAHHTAAGMLLAIAATAYRRPIDGEAGWQSPQQVTWEISNT